MSKTEFNKLPTQSDRAYDVYKYYEAWTMGAVRMTLATILNAWEKGLVQENLVFVEVSLMRCYERVLNMRNELPD